MAEKTAAPRLIMRKSGHCNTAHLNRVPEEAHMRCNSPTCPCLCHFQHFDQFECECGGILVETDWDNPDPTDRDEDGRLEPVYIHVRVDDETGLVTAVLAQECA